jgi:hypothetical protein
MYASELPYLSVDDEKKTITTATNIDLSGRTAVIHNVGPDTLYFSGKGTATADSPELAKGEKTFPRTGKLYVFSAGTSVIKIEYIDQISS